MEVSMSGFEISQAEKDNVTVLYLKGFLDAHTAPQFEKALQQLIKNDKVKIIVNMDQLDYISSAGLGVIMGFIEEIREKNGDIKMSNLSTKVYRVFDLLGFPALYEIYENEDEAHSKFS
jgi:anti-sigma B factor antagonist